MTTDPDRPAVPGLEPADGDPVERAPAFDPQEHPRLIEPAGEADAARPRSRRLGAADDPDRFDPDRFDPDAAPELPTALDPAYDPDRYRPPGQGQTLTDLLGKSGSQEGDRDGYQWVAGLIGVFLFLGLVAFLFNSVLTP